MHLMYYCFRIGYDDIPAVLFCCRRDELSEV